MSVDLNKIADQIVNLSVKDVQSLAKILKEEHGIEPASAAPVRNWCSLPRLISAPLRVYGLHPVSVQSLPAAPG